MNRKAAVSMMTKVIIGLVIAIPLLFLMFKVGSSVLGILFPGTEQNSVSYVFSNFVEYYGNCKEVEAASCSCGGFNYKVLLGDFSIKLEQKEKDVVIKLFSKKEKRIVEEILIEDNVLCYYVLLRKEDERVGALEKFEIEENSMDHGEGTIFSHEGNIFLVKYNETYTCFPTVSPAIENYNEFMKMESCFESKGI